MTFETLLYDVEDRVATIRFDRPEKLNAYTPEMGDETVAAFERARDDDDVRAVVLTGEGRAFCAGVDLDYLKAQMAGEGGHGRKLGEEAFVRSWPLDLVEYPKPVIAAINGTAYGVGVTMTLGCDVRIAARSAVLGLNFTGLGMLPGLGSTHHLPRLIGIGKASELLLSAASISAEEAHRIGLVQRVVDDETLVDTTRELARAMAEIRPEVATAAKRALRHGAEASLADAIREERRLSTELNRARKHRGGA